MDTKLTAGVLEMIQTPTLVLDQGTARKNLEWMAAKAQADGVRMRPHVKTHQSAGVAAWLRDFGVSGITVSSLDMARYFATHGWDDLTVAFTVNPREIDKINRLAAAVKLGLLVESDWIVDFLAERLTSSADIWIKVDVGYHRTGLDWSRQDRILDLAALIVRRPNLNLAGLLTHAGHTYHAGSPDQIRRIFNETRDRLLGLKDCLERKGIGPLAVSVGDTPGCSLAENFKGLDEVRPGNFIFYDLTQVHLGVCSRENLAVAAALPVAAVHADLNKIVVYGGAVHLSKEFIDDPKQGRLFGEAFLPGADVRVSERRGLVRALSQEHGVIEASAGLIQAAREGDLVLVYPVHSCLTANLLGRYLTTDGQWIETMRSCISVS